MNKIRQSNIELLRIISMFYILLYHFSFQLDNHLVIRSMSAILHIGVICFVMISGYWGIRPRLFSFVKLASVIIFYSIICFFISVLYGDSKLSLDSILDCFYIFTSSKYWFVSVYMQLYIVAPLLNSAVDIMNKKQHLLMLSSFAFICIYIGFFRHGMICIDGKNLVNFIFVYLIGRYIYKYGGIYIKLYTLKTIVLLYLTLIILLVIGIYSFPEKYSIITMQLFYSYNSPGIYICSVLFFMIFIKFSFYSRFVNYVASSTFAVYLLHDNPDINGRIYEIAGDLSYNIFLFLAYAIFVFCVSIFIDKIRIIIFKPLSCFCSKYCI